jgi:hypothetical protein
VAITSERKEPRGKRGTWKRREEREEEKEEKEDDKRELQ